jgi:hypothetical protein
MTDRLRYDSPKFYGFQASTSLIQGDAWDVALRYSANYEAIDTKVAAAIAYADGAQRFDLDQFNGSVSLLHGSGLNLTFATGEQDLTGGNAFTRDPSFYCGKIGYQFNPFTIGMTALSVDYGYAEDVAATGDEFTSWGAFAVQNVDKVATELYFGFRNHDLERPGVAVDDINVAVMGARVKF